MADYPIPPVAFAKESSLMASILDYLFSLTAIDDVTSGTPHEIGRAKAAFVVLGFTRLRFSSRVVRYHSTGMRSACRSPPGICRLAELVLQDPGFLGSGHS